MSTITVFGGTGYAGRHIVDEAARRGHQVIAVSRSAGDADGGAEITWTSADVTDAEAVRAAIAKADVVVSALSPRGGLDARCARPTASSPTPRPKPAKSCSSWAGSARCDGAPMRPA